MFRWKAIGSVGILLALLSGEGIAMEVQEPSQVIIEMKGIVCAFCAYGARKNLSRMDFLDRSLFKEGLLLETDKGTITMALAKGKKIDFSKIYKAIKKGGYEISAIHLNLLGKPEKKDGTVSLTHQYNSQLFFLQDENGKSWEPKDFLGQELSVQAVLLEPALSKSEPSVAVSVQVKSVKKLERKIFNKQPTP